MKNRNMFIVLAYLIPIGALRQYVERQNNGHLTVYMVRVGSFCGWTNRPSTFGNSL
jgi:hypothetical protein